MRNVSLIDVKVDGRQSFGLLDPDGRRIAAFDVFANSILRNPLNTRKSYCRSLAKFFDYLIEATMHMSSSAETHLSRDELVKVLEAYREYLVYGGESGNQLARDVNSTLPSPRLSTASCEVMHAPLRRFIELSETLRKHLQELARHDLLSSGVDPNPLFPCVSKRELSSHQTNALLTNSLIAGVISGGPKLIKDAALPGFGGSAPYDEKRAFPFDAAVRLINAMPSWRDKALYCFCAASGCRISEALQLLWPDIRLSDGTVKLIDPARRANDTSYLALEPHERDQLVWKGRATQATLLIEPFASLFFEALERYVRDEYMPHGIHQFVFQHMHHGMEGRPYFLSAPSTRSQIFQKATANAIPCVEGRVGLGVHSLRHMYATYLVNYFPRADSTYGLPIGVVKQLMGHSSVKVTEKYARHDADLLRAELAFANAMVFGNGSSKSLNQMRRDALQAKLRIIECEIEEERTVAVIPIDRPS